MNYLRSGLEKVFFCAGARNHDLLGTFNHQDLKFEFDERMASFKAVGLSKLAAKPVAICTTSGTAVAECVPAMLEAFYSKLPVILISGDRPKKLHGTGSPQTINHEALTASCRGSYFEMTLEEFRTFEIKTPKYPMHINVLIDNTKEHSENPVFHLALDGFANFLKKVSKPVFLFSHEAKGMRGFVERFSKLGLPFYAESLTNARDLSTIKSEKDLLKAMKAGSFDSVIRVGYTPLSKIWRNLELSPLPVFSFDSRNLPALSFGEVLPMGAKEIMESEQWWNLVGAIPPFTLPDATALAPVLSKYPHSEIALFKKLHDLLPKDELIYLGNSLIIRFFELVQTRAFEIHGNRGVNGIDGQLASAVGLAMGTTRSVTCVLGDMTTFYDLSSLREMPENLRLIVMNNKGGRIFETLKLDPRMVMEHQADFAEIAQGFGLSYALNDFEQMNKVKILELTPVKEETTAFLKDWSE